MNSVGAIYGQALYDLACEEGNEALMLAQLSNLAEGFRAEPAYIRLLCAANITKQERCRILDEGFRGRVAPSLLNFMKLLTEKGYMRHFDSCRQTFRKLYNLDHGILEVRAVTAVALSEDQAERLRSKLAAITGKQIALERFVDPAVLGGVRLDYDGKRVDGTVKNRLDHVRSLLANTVL